MTHLPHRDRHPTGVEPADLTEAHRADEPGDHPVAERGGRIERRDVPTVRLDTQTLFNITRWVEEYIAGLVENHHGYRHDVRAVIHDLHYRANVLATAT